MSRTTSEILNLENSVFKTFLTWGAILLLKTLAMSPLTSIHRIKNRAFISQEDCSFLKYSNVSHDHRDIERIRRAHRNDLENIFIFLIAAFLYILTDPCEFQAINLIRVSIVSRCMHSIMYAFYPGHMNRAIAYGITYATTIYMTIIALMHFS